MKKIKDFPVVQEARMMAEAQLSYYQTMMEEKVKPGVITVTKPDRNSPRMLTNTCDGLHPQLTIKYLPTTEAGWLHKLDMERNEAGLQGYAQGLNAAKRRVNLE